MIGTYTIEIPIRTCRNCGERGMNHVGVLFAVGCYCQICLPAIISATQRFTDDAMAEMVRSGCITLPTPLYDPAPPEE